MPSCFIPTFLGQIHIPHCFSQLYSPGLLSDSLSEFPFSYPVFLGNTLPLSPRNHISSYLIHHYAEHNHCILSYTFQNQNTFSEIRTYSNAWERAIAFIGGVRRLEIAQYAVVGAFRHICLLLLVGYTVSEVYLSFSFPAVGLVSLIPSFSIWVEETTSLLQAGRIICRMKEAFSIVMRTVTCVYIKWETGKFSPLRLTCELVCGGRHWRREYGHWILQRQEFECVLFGVKLPVRHLQPQF